MRGILIKLERDAIGRRRLEPKPIEQLYRMVENGEAIQRNNTLFQQIEKTQSEQTYQTRDLRADTPQPTTGKKRGRPRKDAVTKQA